MQRRTSRSIGLLLAAALGILLLATLSWAYPPTGTYANGALWAEITGADIYSCDTLRGTANLGYANFHVWQYSTYYHGWVYPPVGTHVTVSAAITGATGYDRVWGPNGSNDSAVYVATVGANGLGSVPFAGIADTADRALTYTIDAGTAQINRGQGTAGGSGTLHHTYTNPAVESHCLCESPPEGYWVGAGAGPLLVWDGYLKGFTPDLHHRFRLLCEIYDEQGGRVWVSDPAAYPPIAPATDPDLVEFTAEGQHLQHIGPGADHPVPNLAFYIGSNLLAVISIQEAIWYPGQWTSYTTVYYAGTQTAVQAERLFYVTP